MMFLICIPLLYQSSSIDSYIYIAGARSESHVRIYRRVNNIGSFIYAPLDIVYGNCDIIKVQTGTRLGVGLSDRSPV